MSRPTRRTARPAAAAVALALGALPGATAFASARPEGAESAPQEPVEEVAAPAWELSLEQALGLALGRNLGLERSRLDAEAARQDALSSWGAFDWTFSATLRYEEAEREGSTQLAGGDVIETDQASLNLDLTRPFSTGGRFEAHFDTNDNQTTNTFFNSPSLVEDNLRLSYIHPLLRGAGYEATTTQQHIAELGERRAREAIRGARQQLLADVEAAYWDLVAAIEQREVSRSALELGRQQLQQEDQRLAAGDGTEVDVLQARTQIATRTEQLLRTENDVASAEDALRRLLLADDDADSWTQTLLPVTPLPEVTENVFTPSWDEAWETALEQRPELRQSRLDVETARARLRGARSDRLAGLDVRFDLSSGANDPAFRDAARDTLQFDFPTWSVLVSYDLPLGNRTAVHAEQASRERVRAAVVAHEDQELEVLADVRRAVREVSYRAIAVDASQESLDLARRQLDAEEARFEAELSTTFKVLEFQQSWIEALSNARSARTEYAKALSDLERAQGLAGDRQRP